MAVVQSTYSETMRAGLPGMVANAETQNLITRTNAGAAAIGFGQPVIRSGDHGCVLASQETIEAVGANGAPAPAGATISAIVVGAGAKLGVYHAVCILGGAGALSKWQVEDPDGVVVGIATGNTAFTGGGLTFTITDTGADPVIGETFNITGTASVATDDLDVLGISARDASLDVTSADQFPQYESVPVMTMGVIWVTCGATVAPGDNVYWNPATSRYTNTATHLALAGFKFETAGANAGIIKIARR